MEKKIRGPRSRPAQQPARLASPGPLRRRADVGSGRSRRCGELGAAASELARTRERARRTQRDADDPQVAARPHIVAGASPASAKRRDGQRPRRRRFRRGFGVPARGAGGGDGGEDGEASPVRRSGRGGALQSWSASAAPRRLRHRAEKEEGRRRSGHICKKVLVFCFNFM